MEIHYVRQCLADVACSVYVGTLPAECFHVLASRTLRQITYTAELWVIGSSHVMNVITPRGGWAELMVCGQPALPVKDRIWHATKLEDQSWEFQPEPGLSYKIQLGQQRLTPKTFPRRQQQILSEAAEGRLQVCFPPDPEQQIASITLIDVLHCTPEILEIRTCHSYSRDFTFVWTHSTIHFTSRHRSSLATS